MSLTLNNALIWSAALTAAATCIVPPASAQTLELEEITVTAQRRESNLQATPVSVSAFADDQLERFQIDSTENLGDYVPNLYLFEGTSSPSTLSAYMRGLGTGGGGIATSESPVAFYLDDVYQARLSAANNEFADIERVEVLRGPQGTLFGRNSMTGAINVISRTPGDDTYINAEASYGDYEIVALKAAVGGAISPGKVAASISAVYRDHGEGFKHNIATGQDIDRQDFTGIRGKLHFYGSDKFDAVLTAYYSEAKNDGWVATAVDEVTLQPVTGDYFVVQSPIDSFGDSEQIGANFKFTYDFAGITVKSISAYSELDDAWRFDLGSGTEFMPGDYRSVFDRTSQIDQDQFTQEVQLYGDALDDRLDWIAGAYYFTEDSAQTFTDFFFLDFLGFAVPLPVTDYTMNTSSYAVYGEIKYAMTDDLTFIVGGRYTDEDKDIVGFKEIPFANDTSYSAVTPKVGLEYTVNDDMFLYFTASGGFKSGGYEGLGASAEAIAVPFDEETLMAYEIGAKLDLMGNRVRLNLAAYLNDVKDLQSAILDLSVPGNVVTENAVDAELSGFEAELTVLVSDDLTVYAMLGLMHQKLTRIDPRSLVAQAGTERIGGIPDYQGRLGFNYETAVPSLNGSIFVGADYVFRDAFWAAPNDIPINYIPSLEKINARIGYVTDDEHWSVTLAGRNLTDEVDVTSSVSLGLPVGSQLVQNPRIWTLSLRYRH
jgi:iron complex outermembrane receptor protein